MINSTIPDTIREVFHNIPMYVNHCRIEKEGYVYLFKVKHKNIYKIGYTKNINNRFKSLESNMCYYMTVEYAIEGSKKDENILHQQFSKNSIKGEWYRFDIDTLKLVKDQMNNIMFQQDIDFCMESIIEQKKDDLYLEYHNDGFIKEYIKSPLFIKDANKVAINEVNRVKKYIRRYDTILDTRKSKGTKKA